MDELSDTLREKILHARNTDSLPRSEPIASYRNIGALLEGHGDRYEEKIFLISYSDNGHRKEFTYGEILEEVRRTANLLIAFGVHRGDRIAVVSSNRPEVVVQYLAAWLMGAVVVPVNTGEDDRRIEYVLSRSRASLAFCEEQHLARLLNLRGEAPLLRTVIQMDGQAEPSLPRFQEELARQSTRFTPPALVGPDDEALIVYTSGTTGHPKGVVLDQYDLLADAIAIAEWHRLSADQRMMCVLPLHHVNGIVVTLVTPLVAGGSVVLNQRFHTEKFFERISTEGVHVVSVVPTLLQFLLHAHPTLEAYKLGQFRHLICGAGPLTVELAVRFEQELGLRIVHGYGLSETTCYSCFLPIDLSTAEHRRWMSRHGFPSIGVPLPVNEMAIHDESGGELDEGVRGEIVIRGHNVMKAYDDEPAVNEAAFTHGWFRSGDEGFFLYDEEGRKFFFITGRIKEIIIRGGVNISPFEIDEILSKMPGVQAGIAVGFENDWYGEEVGAYVQLKPDLEISEDQVLAHCRKHLPFGKSPKAVVFGTEIPATSTGKYQRAKLRHLFARWKEVQFKEGPT